MSIYTKPVKVNGITYWHCKWCCVEVEKGSRCRHCGRTSRSRK